MGFFWGVDQDYKVDSGREKKLFFGDVHVDVETKKIRGQGGGLGLWATT